MTKLLAIILATGLFCMSITPARADEMADWQKAVVKLVQKKHFYPRQALVNEIEGMAKVSVSFDRSGQITNFEIKQPTGHTELDSALPKMMERLNPLPAPPSSMAGGDVLTMVLPINWVIQ